MRELFDEVAGKSPLDPNESARQSSRGPRRKRFYSSVDVAETADGYVVTLDGRTLKTPGKRLLAVPVRDIAAAISAEWAAQTDIIDPRSMPLARLANSVIDGVTDRTQDVADDIAKYFGSDELFYRADHPEALVARQAQHWDPVLFWAAETLGAHFILAQGILHVQQPEEAIAAARAAMPADAWRLGALHIVTTLTGSALLALALLHRRLDADAVWTAAHVDEDWNIETWGADDEVMSKRAARRVDFDAAAKVLVAHA
ncbi:ATP12 family chaperone protein [Bradyrhizobium prioriisuperbiae]|uniref:ATP12 family chaperone protein n=1 Tax=Bradyrhizobium prioriisuperbiae TaxID=2854389 RepID=UPI0028E7193F|nr:ATP12 family protein [Bradyrhizobium prioritasuperba]